jgi:hypothetical protein
MWTRFHVQCNNCDKVTNLRVQIPEKEHLPISFKCKGCSSELKSILTVDFEKASWDFKVERGTLVKGEFDSGDYFLEFSDTLSTGEPSTIPHSIVVPTMRMPSTELLKLKETKDRRKSFEESEWQDLKDLTIAYSTLNKPVIEKLVRKIMDGLIVEDFFKYNIELDYHRNYFTTLNHLLFPWIDFDNYSDFITWLDKKIFNAANITNPDLIHFVENITTGDLCEKVRIESAELVNRFIDLKDYYFYANHDSVRIDNYAGFNDFNKLKNFYTDCFEFIGRTSHLVFRLQNFRERGNQNSVPSGCPRNITDALSFEGLEHGRRLDILNLSSEPEPKLVFSKSFQSKLRNGINHFKTKINSETQIISYYPITKRPDEEHQIMYIDFLNVSLDCFTSVLKISQLIKMTEIYKKAIEASRRT